MPFASSPCGARVSYSVAGSGPALVLLHGTGGDGFSHWGAVQAGLDDSRRVICPDYAGSGRTEDSGGSLTLEALADQVLAVMDAEQVTQADLVGYSLGAVLAAAIAARHPQRVRQLMLVAGFAHGSDARAQLQFGLWDALLTADTTLMARFLLLTGASPAWLAAQTPEQLDKRVRAIVRFTNWPGMARQIALDGGLDIRGLLPRIVAPTWVVVGDQDQMIPRAMSRELLNGIAGAKWHELPGGHLLPLEQPAALAALIRSFTTG